MKAQIISFTKTGMDLSQKICHILEGTQWQVNNYVKSKHIEKNKIEHKSKDINVLNTSLDNWVQSWWSQTEALVFIGATGIAVRAIAPMVQDKRTDPAVIVIDEKGNYVIPILSGHIGGANELAKILAKEIQAEPVITTATDLHNCFAVDVHGKELGWTLKDKAQAREISAALLAGEKMLTLGIGCRKNTDYEKISAVAKRVCEELGLKLEHIARVASIDLKKEEPGILALASKLQIPFYTYSAQQLEAVPGTYNSSLFVQSVTGVDNVCERSAILASDYGVLIQKKVAKDGVTVALAINNKGEEDE